MRYLIVIIALFSLPAYAENGTSQILEGITPNSITIIGETHKRPESIKFFQSLITGYTQQNKCLTIALEIASSQQLFLDEIMQGRATVTDIEIPSVIDHPPLRTLIDELAEMRKRQQMQWSPKGAHLLLQMRTRVLNDELEQTFREWYPCFRVEHNEMLKKRLSLPRFCILSALPSALEEPPKVFVLS